MPEISVTLILLIVVALVAGLAAGWIFRGRRADGEKAAINAGWKDQLEAQRKEHERLVEQNKSLMEQNSQYQASNKDSKMRAAELSAALKEAFERRDELQRQIKDIRGNLETAVAAREQLESDMAHRSAEVDVTATALKQRDDRIAQLQKELKGWQERVPPLVERFRLRNEEAESLERELAAANERIDALEAMLGSDQTRVEPVDTAALTDAFLASNEPMDGPEDMEPEDVEPDYAEPEHPEPEHPEPEHAEPAHAAERQPGDVAEDDRPAYDEPAAEALADDDPADDDPGDEDPGTIATAAEPDPAASAPASGNGEDRDNLKLIKGVGPAIEKTLNEMGIRRLHQIAEMSEYDIDRIARRLKGFRSRIYREDWMGQARSLLENREAAEHH